MADLARFPHPPEAVEELLDLAFLYGLNTVHLHLTDDQAFTFPASCLPPRPAAGENGANRGYSRAELTRFVQLADYCAAHGLPPIDTPGAANELLIHFLARVTGIVRDLGRRPVLWEGFRAPLGTDNVVPTDALMMCWSQESQTPEALIAAGYSIVNCGWDPLYVVPAQGYAARPREAFDWNPRQVRQRFGGRRTELPVDAPLLGAQVCLWENRPEAIVPSLDRVLPELAAINHEQFAHVEPRAHVDLRPLSDVFTRAARVDPLRPRIWGRHAMRAEGQVDIPMAGEWTIRASSRSAMSRVVLGSAVVCVARGSDTTVATGTLVAGTYGLTIEHAVPDVHNDLQLTLQGPGEGEPRVVYSLLRPISD